MAATIGAFAVRRSVWIRASPGRVWREFESLERICADGFGQGHALVAYEPRVGGRVETAAGGSGSVPLRFGGPVTDFEPARELTFENDWLGRGWRAPSSITIRLTPALDGTVCELFHHGFERTGESPGDLLAGFDQGWGMTQLQALRELVEG